jgi:hypothetical protein
MAQTERARTAVSKYEQWEEEPGAKTVAPSLLFPAPPLLCSMEIEEEERC